MPGDEGQARRQRRQRLRVPGDRVVVGQRDDVQARGRGLAHHVGRRVRAVRDAAVGMKIDAHVINGM